MTSTIRTDIDLSVDEEAVVAFTQELVRIRSVNDPGHGGGEAPVAELVADRMRALGWEPQVVEVAPGRPNVVAVVDGGGGPGPTLMFEGHTDVVTEGDLSAWTVDPYGAEIRGGRLHGRGSADMKSGVAAMIYAVKAVQDAGPFPGRIVVGALVDEEGLMLGAKHFARTALAAEVDGVIVCEPEEGEICAVAKGAVRLSIELTGAMAHGAMPQHARNPLPVAARVITGLEQVQQRLQDEHGEHEHLGWTYLTPTVSLAGDVDQINVIPARATVCVDTRTIPGVDHTAMVEAVTAMAREAAEGSGVRVDVEVVDDRPAVDTPVDHPVVAALAAAHEHVVGRPAVYGGVPGATDGTILTRDAGLATVVYGPGGKWIAHQADEFVEVADIVRCAQGLRRGGPAVPDREHRMNGVRTGPTNTPDRRGRYPGRPRHPARRRLAVRHHGGADRTRRRRRRGGRARRRPGHPRDRPARPAQRGRARARGGPHRRQRVRPGRGRRRDAGPVRRRGRLPGGRGGRGRADRARRGDLRPRPRRRLRQPTRRDPRRRGLPGRPGGDRRRGRAPGGRRGRDRRQRRTAQGRDRFRQRGARRRHDGGGAGRGQPVRVDRRPRDGRAVRRAVRPRRRVPCADSAVRGGRASGARPGVDAARPG